MLEHVTLGQVAIAITFLVGLIVGIKYLKSELKTSLTDMLKENFDEINKKLDDMTDTIDNVDMQTCKNFLVRYLADIEREDVIYEQEKQRFWEEYEHYTKVGGNSYIKEWVDRLKREGKL